MRHAFLWMACATAFLTGCERPAPAPANTESAEASAPDSFTAEQRTLETPRLKGYEAQIRRNAGQLVIHDGGRAVATFTDNTDYAWFFTGRFTKGDAPFYLVRLDRLGSGAMSSTYVFDRAGQPVAVLLQEVLVADGPQLLSGSGGSMDGLMTRIDDWSSETRVFYEFKVPCDPVEWIDTNHVSAECATEEDDSNGQAVISRIAPDTWELKETPSPTATDRKAYYERAKARSLTPVDAETIRHLTAAGFNRLQGTS